MFKCTTILQTVYQALKYISEYILQCYAVLFQNTVHLPKKALFLCYAPYYIFMPMNLLKETCVQKFHVTYLLKSVTRMTLFQELILLTFGSLGNLEKFWSKYRRFLSCNWPFLLAKNVPFLLPFTMFTIKDRVQKVIYALAYYFLRLYQRKWNRAE